MKLYKLIVLILLNVIIPILWQYKHKTCGPDIINNYFYSRREVWFNFTFFFFVSSRARKRKCTRIATYRIFRVYIDSNDKCDIGCDPVAVNNFLKYLKIAVNKSLRSWDHRNPSRLPGIPSCCASPLRMSLRARSLWHRHNPLSAMLNIVLCRFPVLC